MARILRSYDHGLCGLVRSTGDIGHATRRGVPRSTARGWLTSTHAEVVTIDIVDMDAFILQQEVIVLRARVGRLVALLRLLVVLLKVSGFSLARARLPNGATKNSLLRAIERLRSSLPLGTVLRVLVTIFRTRKSRMSCGSKRRAGSALGHRRKKPLRNPSPWKRRVLQGPVRTKFEAGSKPLGNAFDRRDRPGHKPRSAASKLLKRAFHGSQAKTVSQPARRPGGGLGTSAAPTSVGA